MKKRKRKIKIYKGHSMKFWRRQFKKYKKEVTKRGNDPKIEELDTFVGSYIAQAALGEKGSYSYQIARDEIYSLGYKASISFFNSIKESTDEKISFTEFRKMTYEERQSRFGDRISEMYWERISAGDSKKEAHKFISLYWYGSSTE